MEDDIKNLGLDIEKFERRVTSINIEDNAYKNKQELDDLEKMYQKLYSQIEDCDNDIQESAMASNKKPLISKLSQYKSDLEIAKNKLNEKKNKWQTQYNMELLKEGKLSGAEKVKTERDMIISQNKETDYQGNIINSIASNIKDTNRNLERVNNELKNQGDQMNRIHDHTMNAQAEVKQTERIMTKMERRQKCLKIMGVIAVFVLGLFDIVWLVY